MNRKETIAIMAMLSAFYGQGKASADAMANAWAMVLEPYDFVDAQSAVIEFARCDTRDYATFPAPGTIIKIIEEHNRMKSTAVEEIIRTICGGLHYEHLSKAAQALINEETYEQWRHIDAEKFNSHAGEYRKILKGRQRQLISEAKKE